MDCGCTFDVLVVEEEISKLWGLPAIDGAYELVDSGGRGGGDRTVVTIPHTTPPYLLGVVTMTKHFELEEGKGSQCRPVMGSLCSDASYN